IYQSSTDELLAERRELMARIAKMIRRLSLSAEQIRELPDNFAAAIAAKGFPTSYSADQPGKPYLPAELLDAAGPWVVLGGHMRSVAPTHVRFASGRSAFLVFINLPAGRKATLEYLKDLAAFPNPVLPRAANDNIVRLNPE